MHVDILTLFPEVLEPYLKAGIPRIAAEKGAFTYRLHDFRNFGEGNYRRVDERPFGGGPGMVLTPGPIFACLESFLERPFPPIVATSPQGRTFDQKMAEEMATWDRFVILCGHYEGFDERIVEGLGAREVSIGDYVLSGGELAALVLMDSVVRLLAGVLGDDRSAALESFSTGVLDYPQYTRPVEFRGMSVPEILRSGDHAKIAAWRRAEALRRTRERRPDLLNPRGEETKE